MDIDYFFVSRTAILLFCFLPSSVSLAFSGIFNAIPSDSFLEKKLPKALSQSFTTEAASLLKWPMHPQLLLLHSSCHFQLLSHHLRIF